jgi:hypothetical protein
VVVEQLVMPTLGCNDFEFVWRHCVECWKQEGSKTCTPVLQGARVWLLSNANRQELCSAQSPGCNPHPRCLLASQQQLALVTFLQPPGWGLCLTQHPVTAAAPLARWCAAAAVTKKAQQPVEPFSRVC